MDIDKGLIEHWAKLFESEEARLSVSKIKNLTLVNEDSKTMGDVDKLVNDIEDIWISLEAESADVDKIMSLCQKYVELSKIDP